MGRCIVLAFCTLSLDTRRCKSVVSSSVLSECLFLFAASCERQLAPHDPTLYRASEFSVQDYKKMHLQRGRCSVVRSTAKSSKGPNRASTPASLLTITQKSGHRCSLICGVCVALGPLASRSRFSLSTISVLLSPL